VEASGHLRIGELSRRSGVSPELLRAWERRYGLLEPTRTEGGLRLYSDDDLERVLAMQRHLADGIAAAEAAAIVARGGAAAATALRSSRSVADLQDDLGRALSHFDEPGAQNVLDTLFAATTLDASLSGVLLPYLHELGDRWAQGDASVAEEHFASGVLRGRLLGLARGWGRGLGPRIVLACVPGEQHDLGLIAFGLALRARGWRVVYLGADTPLDSVATAARLSDPRFVVLAAVDVERFRANLDGLRELADSFALCLGGAGATEEVDELAAWRLLGDPVEEAEGLTSLAQEGTR
jgi:MerR family transcriptional regulator, light-induced transcriptional regulator